LSQPKSISQRLISGGFFAASGKIILAVSSLALNTLITRLLSPDVVGVYYIIASIVAVAAIAVQLGSHQAIVKLLAINEPGMASNSIRGSIKAAFIIAGFGICIFSAFYLLGFGKWLGEELFMSALVVDMVLPTTLWVGLLALQILFSQIFRGFHNIGYASIFEGVSTGVFAVISLFAVWLIYEYSSLQLVLWVINLSLLLSLVIAFFLFRKIYLEAPKTNEINIRGLTHIGFPLFVASIAIPGFTEMHVWILSVSANDDEVAIYGAAFRLAKFVVVPLLIINSVIPPMIAQFIAGNRLHDAERVLRSTAAIAGVSSILIVIFLMFIGKDILSLIFGEFYEQGSAVLIILACAQALNALTGSPGVLLMMSGHQSIFMKLAIISGIIGAVTSFLLVSALNYIGVAIGVSTALVLHNLAMWLYCQKQLGISTHMGLSHMNEVVVILMDKFVRNR